MMRIAIEGPNQEKIPLSIGCFNEQITKEFLT